MMEPGTSGLKAQTCPSVSERRVGGQRSECRRRVGVQEKGGGGGVRNRQVQLTWSSRSLASVSANQP